MTNDEIIKRLLDLKIIVRSGGDFTIPPRHDRVVGFAVLHDWRVAGACLEKWPTTISVPADGPLASMRFTLDEMLRQPSLICQAFVLAHVEDRP